MAVGWKRAYLGRCERPAERELDPAGKRALAPGYELRPKTLPDIVPTLVYVTPAPFLEAEDAYEVAVG